MVSFALEAFIIEFNSWNDNQMHESMQDQTNMFRQTVGSQPDNIENIFIIYIFFRLLFGQTLNFTMNKTELERFTFLFLTTTLFTIERII